MTYEQTHIEKKTKGKDRASLRSYHISSKGINKNINGEMENGKWT